MAWIYTTKGYVSIVAHNDLVDRYLVRARERSTLVDFMPDETITTLDDADYPHRILTDGVGVMVLMGKISNTITYTNFKNAVKQPDRLSAYYGVYAASLALDDRDDVDVDVDVEMVESANLDDQNVGWWNDPEDERHESEL